MEEVCPVRAFYGQGWGDFFWCKGPHFLVQKNFGFFEIYDLHGQGGGGWASVDILRKKRGGGDQIFEILYGRRLLWTAM